MGNEASIEYSQEVPSSPTVRIQQDRDFPLRVVRDPSVKDKKLPEHVVLRSALFSMHTISHVRWQPHADTC